MMHGLLVMVHCGRGEDGVRRDVMRTFVVCFVVGLVLWFVLLLDVQGRRGRSTRHADRSR